MEKSVVRAITLERNESRITVVRVPDKPGIAYKIFYGPTDPVVWKPIGVQRLKNLLNEGYTPVEAGYLGVTEDWEITPLGRGGSDLSAVALAYALGADCEIYTDVVCLAKKVGLKYQRTIVWNEQNISRRTAWGSWLSASAPYIIAPVEMTR